MNYTSRACQQDHICSMDHVLQPPYSKQPCVSYSKRSVTVRLEQKHSLKKRYALVERSEHLIADGRGTTKVAAIVVRFQFHKWFFAILIFPLHKGSTFSILGAAALAHSSVIILRALSVNRWVFEDHLQPCSTALGCFESCVQVCDSVCMCARSCTFCMKV